MRFFLYYALHSFKNQLKKLFKTWVLIFLVACMLLGGVIGLGAAKLEKAAKGDEPAAETEEKVSSWDDPEKRAELLATVELIAGGVVLALLVYEILSADKSGGKLFLPADVNLLFPSPMQPQSVLLFRLGTQLGAAVFASVYLLFQLPNLVLNLGFPLWGALGLIGAWCLTIVLGKLIQVLVYLLCSNHPALKRNLQRGVYALLGLLALGWFLFWKRSGLELLPAARGFFNAPLTRYIPVWGWIKGLCLYAIEGNLTASLLCIAGCVAAGIVLWRIIRATKADFYEDAMAKSEETAELLERARNEKSSGLVISRRKKDRSDKLRRDGMTHGWGAGVFFWKSLYNRFRFAHLGLFTKTTETYLAAGVGVGLLCRFVFVTDSLLPVVLSLAGLAFFRALGNPLSQDTKMDFFRLIPESPWAKLFCSLMGGTVNCLLDLLPGLILGALAVGGSIWEALGWIPFILTVDLYCTCVGAFIDLSVPVAAGKTVKQVIQIMFVYFGLLPDVAIIAVGLVMGYPFLAALASAAVNLVLGGLFFALCPLYLEPGSREAPRREGAGDPQDAADARRAFSRMGWACTAVLVIGSVLQILVAALLPSDWAAYPGASWLGTFLPLYAVSFPLSFLLLRSVKRFPGEKTHLSPGRYAAAFLISVFLMYAGNLLGIGVNALLDRLIRASDGNLVATLAMSQDLPWKILFMVVLAPLFEELLFRRALIDRMRPYGERLAVVTSAVMFGLFHGNLSQFFYAALLGLVFGYVYLKSGRLGYSLGLHMAINALGSVIAPELVRRAGMAGTTLGLSGLEAPGSGSLGLIAYSSGMLLCAAAGLVLLIIRKRKIVFAQAPRPLRGRDRFTAVWLNPGMIVFFLVCLGLMAFSIR